MAKIKVRKSYQEQGFSKPVFQYRPDWPYVSIGFGDEKDYFIENLSLLISSGMGISAALSSLTLSVKSKKMKKIAGLIEQMVNSGLPLYQAFSKTKLIPERIISLVRAGEEAGRLADHLNLVTLQQNKEKLFRSRLRSALIYPSIVLFLAFIVGLASFWFILPKIVNLFSELDASLPLATRLLINFGIFFENYGLIAVPSIIIFIVVLIYCLFFNKKTKFIGDAILFSLPGIKNLVQGIELARFGYISGTLLQAGLQIGQVFEIMKKGTNYQSYRKIYDSLEEKILKGESFKKAILSYPKIDKYMPIPIQQLIISSEKSGRLAETFIRIGVIFEEKTEAMSKDLATVLEPIVLIIVGIIVAFIVMAIIGPIYGLSQQI